MYWKSLVFVMLCASMARVCSRQIPSQEVSGSFMSYSSVKSAVMLFPQSIIKYWHNFVQMEMECIFRMICDLTAYVSPRLPYWLNQLLGVYFTTNSANNVYYRAVANGMINQNCVNYYPKCSSNTFFKGMASNMSDIITTTISPLILEAMNTIRDKNDLDFSSN